MKLGHTGRLARLLVGATALTCGAVAGPLTANHAHADVIICRTDPIIHLADGTNLDVRATIGDSKSDINGVSFSVSLPPGAQVVSITDTGNGPSNETVTVNTGGPGYGVDTYVSAGQNASVNVSLLVSGAGQASTSGSTNTTVSTQVGS